MFGDCVTQTLVAILVNVTVGYIFWYQMPSSLPYGAERTCSSKIKNLNVIQNFIFCRNAPPKLGQKQIVVKYIYRNVFLLILSNFWPNDHIWVQWGQKPDMLKSLEIMQKCICVILMKFDFLTQWGHLGAMRSKTKVAQSHLKLCFRWFRQLLIIWPNIWGLLKSWSESPETHLYFEIWRNFCLGPIFGNFSLRQSKAKGTKQKKEKRKRHLWTGLRL